MNTCCEPMVHNFVNEYITTIPYGDYERSVYGVRPQVDIVYYHDPTWQQGGVFTEVKYTANSIRIEHGGQYTGYVKIS